MTTPHLHETANALALMASEWFKVARRLMRLTQELAPARAERERAQLAYAHSRIESVLAENNLRMVTHEGAESRRSFRSNPSILKTSTTKRD